MTYDAWQIVIACAASLLVGGNIALLVEFGSRLASWWTFKLCAVMILLTYITAAMIYANPDISRTIIATIAIVVDIVAFARVYKAVRSARRGGLKLVVYTPRNANGKEMRG